jgi:hypothetical protein
VVEYRFALQDMAVNLPVHLRRIGSLCLHSRE